MIKPGGVVNAADYTDGNVEGIARGSIFSVFGYGWAEAANQPSGLPLPTALQGVRVRVYASTGGSATEAPLLYVSRDLINAIMPSRLPDGPASVTVERNGVESSPARVTLVPTRFAAFTQSGYGFGPAAIQQVDEDGKLSLNRFLAPARPGQTVVLWGTGLGPLPSGSEVNAPGVNDLSNGLTVWVGGTAVRPLYAGRAPSHPGLDQINFVLPARLVERCYVTLFVQTGQTRSNTVTVATGSPPDACTSEFALPLDVLSRLDDGGQIRVAVLSFRSETTDQIQQSAEAWLSDYDAAYLSGLATQDSPPVTDGTCSRREYSYSRSRPLRAVPPGPYGMVLSRIVGSLDVQIQGGAGCTWPMSPGDDGVYRSGQHSVPCLALGYSFGGRVLDPRRFQITGDLPKARQAIASFSVDRAGPQPRASWQISSQLPGDTVLLTVGSMFQLTGNISDGATTVRQLSCGAHPEGSPFLLSQPDYDWALYLPQNPQTQMTVQAATYQLVNVATTGSVDSVDFILTRTRNSAAAIASVSR